jgi:hypothetical protein
MRREGAGPTNPGCVRDRRRTRDPVPSHLGRTQTPMQSAIHDGVVAQRTPCSKGAGTRRLTGRHRHALSRSYASAPSDDTARTGE